MAGDAKPLEIPLNGKLKTGVDGTQLETKDFKVLKNMRYTATGIKGIMGQTKYNTTVTGDANGRVIVSAHHFKKDQPSESHFLAQIQRTDATDSAIYDNTTAIGSQGDFSSIKASVGGTVGGFANAPDSSVVWCNGTNNFIWSGDEFRVAQFVNYDGITAVPTYKYDFTEKINNTTNDASNRATLKRINSAGHNYTYIYIGSTRPISGIKFYLDTVNATAATAAVNYWSGSAWASVASLSDGTSVGGKTMAQTGSMTFTATTATAKTKIIDGKMAYWYQVILTDADDNITVYHCTVAAPWEPITDIWDGVNRELAVCKVYVSSLYQDKTVNISARDWVSGVVTTYLSLAGFATGNAAYFGSTERLCGLDVQLAPTASNGNASTLTVKYWNGAAWTAVTALSDGTKTGGVPLDHSGIISWSPIAENTEFVTNVGDEVQYYYYQLAWDNALGGNTAVDYVTAIPAPKTIVNYNRGTMWQNRLCLIDETTNKRNKILVGSYESCCVFNGSDSTEFIIGDNAAVTNAVPFFTRISGDFYESLVITKNNETWVADGTTPEDYKLYRLSRVYGCAAPNTMKTCDVGVEVIQGISKHVIIWQAATAVVIMDGVTVSSISEDIRDLFDPNASVHIDFTKLDESWAFFDERELEYHWLFTDSASARRELVYDLMQRKWFEIDRTSTKRLVCGTMAEDTDGNRYAYGCDASGYAYRLEYGTDFDGQDIVQQFTKPDLFPAGSTLYETEITHVQLIAKAKNTTANHVAITHYGDGATTGTSLVAADVADATHRIIPIKRRLAPNKHLTHSLAFSLTTDDETYGFEPLFLSAWYKIHRESA